MVWNDNYTWIPETTTLKEEHENTAYTKTRDILS